MHLFLGNFLSRTYEMQETGDRRDAKRSPQMTIVHEARAVLLKCGNKGNISFEEKYYN